MLLSGSAASDLPLMNLVCQTSEHARRLSLTQSMVQAFGVRDTSEILWLIRERFIAHQVYVEGIGGATLQEKEEAAEAKWKRDISNADIVRRGTGLDTQLGVLGVPRTQG